MAKITEPPFRAGFVAIVGRPNVGKSTLLNRILGEHLAIVSPRPQTTRTRILGVYTSPDVQLALFDTPGLHRAKGALNKRMVEVALQTLGEVDAVLFLVEAGTGPEGRVEVGESTRWAIEEVAKSRKPAVLGISKMDRAPRPGGRRAALPARRDDRPGRAPDRGRVRPRAGDGPDAAGDPLRRRGRGRGVRRVRPARAGRARPRLRGDLGRAGFAQGDRHREARRDAEEHRDARAGEPRAAPRLQGVPHAHRQGRGALERARGRTETARHMRLRPT